tara:strand:+ start:59 stop:244 length:186 start_codon:yes stop_codon:yes gene_type:complete
MQLSELIAINEEFKDLHKIIKEARNTCKNRTLFLVDSYMDDAQNRLHQAIGEAAVSGKLEK